MLFMLNNLNVIFVYCLHTSESTLKILFYDEKLRSTLTEVMGAYWKYTRSSAVSSFGKLSFEVTFQSRISVIFNIVLISRGLCFQTYFFLFLIVSPILFGVFYNRSTFLIILMDSVNNNPLVSKRVISVGKKPKLALILINLASKFEFLINCC